MRALSIRQPYTEEILRGIKTIEYRPGPTNILDEPFYIYAASKCPPDDQLAQFSKLCRNKAEWKKAAFPTGVLVGVARIVDCTPPTSAIPFYHWHLDDVQRLDKPLKPKGHPQPSWFYPF